MSGSQHYRALLSLIDASDPRELSFTPVTMDDGTGPLAAELASRGVTLVGLRASARWAGVLPAAFRLARLVRHLRPDVIHSNLFFPSVTAETARWLLSDAPPSLLCRHHNLQHHMQRKRLHKAADRIAARRATRVIAVSEAVKATMTELEHVDPQKIDVVYNGYDWSALTPEPPRVEGWRQRIPARPLIVAAGRLDPIKDLPTLLTAVALVAERHPTVTLAIAGTGPASVEADLRAHASQLGIAERVLLLGYVEPLHELVAAADVFAQASLDEACSQTISEALGLGVPVAVTTTGGTAELVQDVQAPIAAQRPDLLARRLLKLLDDPSAARRAAKAAAPRARERFATSLQLERYQQLYEAVVTAGTNP